MFSRRHPYLFFILVFSFIVAVTLIVFALLVVIGARYTSFAKFGKTTESVGIIEIVGAITHAKDTLRSLKQFREDDSIKAIVLRIDSPGGAVGPSQEIFREIRKTLKSKTVIASMGTVAASGGYYIAAGTDGIVANAGTITGSIGVVMGFTNFQEIFRRIGLVPVVVKSGDYKDIGSPVREMTEAERKILQNLVDNVHQQFVKDVAESRNMSIDRVSSLADGRIFTGEEAKALGLVDRIGNMEDSIEWAGRKGGIKGKISVVYAPEKKFSLLRYITDIILEEISNRTIYPELYPAYTYR
jgi:protease-4